MWCTRCCGSMRSATDSRTRRWDQTCWNFAMAGQVVDSMADDFNPTATTTPTRSSYRADRHLNSKVSRHLPPRTN